MTHKPIDRKTHLTLSRFVFELFGTSTFRRHVSI